MPRAQSYCLLTRNVPAPARPLPDITRPAAINRLAVKRRMRIYHSAKRAACLAPHRMLSGGPCERLTTFIFPVVRHEPAR